MQSGPLHWRSSGGGPSRPCRPSQSGRSSNTRRRQLLPGPRGGCAGSSGWTTYWPMALAGFTAGFVE
eukprot:4722627-Alexandrium_andersonii.AAC.1